LKPFEKRLIKHVSFKPDGRQGTEMSNDEDKDKSDIKNAGMSSMIFLSL
jgi:hypothetical protein